MQSETRYTSHRGAIVLVACLMLLGAGCSPENTKEPPAEESSRTADAKVKPLLLQGEKALRRGSYQRAMALADSAEHYGPELPLIPFFRGSIYAAQNRFEAAQAAYQKVVALDSTYPEAHLRMGNGALQRGHPREALRLYKKEEAIAPTAALYVKMGRAYAELGVADSARRAYQKAVARDSTNARAHMAFGQFLEQTGDLEAALARSRRALALEPKNANYQFAVGAQLFQAGHLQKAIKPLKQAADARLLHYPAQYNLGQVLTRLGRDAQADYYLARADSARRLMDQITAARNRTSRPPEGVRPWARLGRLYRRADEPEKALEAFRTAADLQPDNLAVQNSMAEIMLANGNPRGAIRGFRAILEADRTQVAAWLHLGLAHAAAGHCEAARHAWKAALKHAPGNVTAKKYLAGLCTYTAR